MKLDELMCSIDPAILERNRRIRLANVTVGQWEDLLKEVERLKVALRVAQGLTALK